MTDPKAGRVAADAVAKTTPELSTWTGTFELLADPTRLKILIAVHAAPDSSVGEIASAASVSANAVSQALASLAEAGVVTGRRDGRYRRWTLTDDAAHELLHHIRAPHSALHPEH
ncbi:DNA-binding transcriptional ArsR family regulator [Kineosphaera limosa]|uniref:Putative ArsR family transcriptional regulator n=1 Tax=Kineosphaera limosa NBRC 100340 TaxID=1184609 RepID=K6XF42_9MICO|nr:metalloregulator ArsR/SmtB family transcription factor [Kineosphaera limosa]NYE01668.1 DNA-binding transcriptional ArsR family regulator [Kineosphaera limosa]GAB97439.1 putative ArsR family transcriptional regulator [Kineosphaera limosa NBRC 100340]